MAHGYEEGRLNLPLVGICTFGKAPLCAFPKARCCVTIDIDGFDLSIAPSTGKSSILVAQVLLNFIGRILDNRVAARAKA